MFGSSIVMAALSALTMVSATNFTIDPNSVLLSTRASWCTAESNTCDTLCSLAETSNSCDPNLLTYSCTCSDGTSPDVSQYSQSLPAFICQEAFRQCNLANVGSQTGQANCTKTIQDNCGTKNATAIVASSTGTSSTAAPSGTASNTATASSVSTTSSKAGAMPTNIQHIGNGAAVIAVGLLAYVL